MKEESSVISLELSYSIRLSKKQLTESLILINKKFNYAIILLSKTIFVHEDNPVETMFTTMLMDKTISYTNTLVGGRIPKTDAETLAVLSEEAIIFYIAYIDKLKLLFTNAHHQNKMTNGKGITWKEICDKKD